MGQVISQPDHGDTLFDEERKAINVFQIFLDDFVRQFNLLEIQINPVMQLNLFTVATLPDPTVSRGALIYVTDDALGEVPAYSNGTNWLRVFDKGIVS